MTTLIYIGMAKLAGGSWTALTASDSEREVLETTEKFQDSGYITKVQQVCLYLTENEVSRIWRAKQKQLELEASERFDII